MMPNKHSQTSTCGVGGIVRPSSLANGSRKVPVTMVARLLVLLLLVMPNTGSTPHSNDRQYSTSNITIVFPVGWRNVSLCYATLKHDAALPLAETTAKAARSFCMEVPFDTLMMMDEGPGGEAEEGRHGGSPPQRRHRVPVPTTSARTRGQQRRPQQ